MTALLAVDPGRTTGIAWCDSVALLPGAFDERIGGLVRHKQLVGTDVEISRMIVKGARAIGAHVVVMESFQLRPGVALKGDDALSPVRIASMVEYGMCIGELGSLYVSMQLQTPSQGKSVMTDARMRAVGCWWPGQDHAVDAARHLLTFVRRVRSGKVVLPDGLWTDGNVDGG